MKHYLIHLATSLMICNLLNGVCYAQFTSSPSNGTTSTGMTYFLKKKLLTVSFNYTIKSRRTSIVIKDELDQIVDETLTKVTIDNSVTLVQTSVNDPAQEYTIQLTGKKAAEREIELAFGKYGALKTVNGKSESVLPAIVGAVGTVAATVVRTIGIFANPIAAGAAEDKRVKKKKVEEITTIIPVSYVITEPGSISVNTFSVDSVLKSISNPGVFNVDLAQVVTPKLKLSIEPLFKTSKGVSLTVTESLSNSSVNNGIVYRKPAPFIVKVNLINNNNISEYTVLSQVIDIPQFGKLGTIPLENNRGNFELIVEQDEESGMPIKYVFKKKPNAKKVAESINQSLTSIQGAVDTLRTQVRERNKAEETKNSDSTLLQKQITELTLEKQSINLQMEVDSLRKKLAQTLETPIEKKSTTNSSSSRKAALPAVRRR